jgi:hypothetical protein
MKPPISIKAFGIVHAVFATISLYRSRMPGGKKRPGAPEVPEPGVKKRRCLSICITYARRVSARVFHERRATISAGRFSRQIRHFYMTKGVVI